jgi:hypothetical protein
LTTDRIEGDFARGRPAIDTFSCNPAIPSRFGIVAKEINDGFRVIGVAVRSFCGRIGLEALGILWETSHRKGAAAPD